MYLVAPLKSASLDPEDQILRDEEEAGLSPEELEDGMAQFDAFFSNDMKPRS